MEALRAFLLVTSLLVATGSSSAFAADDVPPVVVELFTSQGCSSCPPADAYLGDLAKRSDVLALGFHVDYWNYIGWADPFAARFASERQRSYAGSLHLQYVYTPQMVVNGISEGTGSDRSKIERLISSAAAQHTQHPSITLTRGADGQITVHIGATPSGESANAVVWLVSFDRRHSTNVPRGENGGRTLIDYNAVRSLERIGAWTGEPLDLSVAASSAPGDGGIAALLQQDGTGPILTAARIDLPQH
jgi:hypothetical protein